HQDRGDIGTDAEERGLTEGHLPRVADGEVEAHRRHQIDAAQRHEVDVAALERPRERHERCDDDDEDSELCALHTLRSSDLPSSPSGRNRMTRRNSTSATPSLYAGARQTPSRF